MLAPSPARDEHERLKALEDYHIVDTPIERSFDALTHLLARALNVPIALISIVDADRQWFKSRYGLEAPETPRSVSFCGHVVASDDTLVVPDASADLRFADNPLVTGQPHVGFYAGAPLRIQSGHILGTLCAIDHVPRQLTLDQLEVLHLLAGQVVALLELRHKERLLQGEREALASHRRFFELSPDLLCTFDRALNFGLVNRAWTHTLGWSLETLRAGRLTDFIHPDDLTRIATETAHLFHAPGETSSFETRVRHERGYFLMLSWVATATEQAIFAAARDVTAEKARTCELVRAKDAAERAMRARSDFLARMSHEIRTPMNGVLGMLELLSFSTLDAEQRDQLATAQQSARGLLGIIDDVLDFSKIDAGKLRLESVRFELRACLCSVVRGFAELARSKGLELGLDIANAVPDTAVGDPHRIQQVLINLIGNAIKFTERGRVTLSCEAATANDTEIGLRFAVSDTGVGIPPDKHATIVAAFGQADEATTRRFGGTGLGLTISSDLVQLMGGKLEVESELGRGSRFGFSLRLGRDRALGVDSIMHQQPKPPAPKAGPRAPKRILLAEDNAINQKVAISLLRREGHSVTAVETGRAALAALASSQFDVVLMDVQMPDMDGLDATRAIRSAEATSGHRIPIIALTAQAMEGDRERCLAAGVDGYVSKPLDASVLYAAIETLTAPQE